MDLENQVTPPEEEAVQAVQPEEIPAAEAPVEMPAEEVPVEETPAEEAPVEEAPVEEAPVNATEQSRSQPGDSHFDLDRPQEKPKKKTGLILGIVAVVAAIALVFGLIFGLGGKGGKKEDPHTAMINAQRDALYSAIDAFGAGLDNMEATADASENMGSYAYMDLHVLLSESILDRLELMLSQYGAELDCSFLQDIAISFDINRQDLVTQYLIGLGLGDKEITYLDYIMDLDKGMLYMGLPELNPNYAASEFVSISELSTGLQSNFQDSFNKLAENMPDREAMQSCLRGYVDLMLDQLKDPTVGEESVTVGEVTQTLTTVTYRLTEAQLLEFGKASVEKLKADETVKQFLEAYIDYVTTAMEGAGDTPEMHFESYEDALQQALTELDQMISEAKDGNYIDLTGYLDQKQTLRGYKMAPYGEDVAADQWLRWITLEDGDKELVEIAIREKEETLLAVTGTQKVKDSIYNGIFKLTFPERRSLTVELMDMTMDPFLKGSIQLTPNTNLLKEIAGDSYTTLRILGANLGLRIDIEGGADSGGFGFHFTADGSSLVGITMDAAYKASDPITLPDESKLLTGEDAMDQLMAGLDLTKLPEKLEAAGVPAELVEMLEQLLLMSEDAA